MIFTGDGFDLYTGPLSEVIQVFEALENNDYLRTMLINGCQYTTTKTISGYIPSSSTPQVMESEAMRRIWCFLLFVIHRFNGTCFSKSEYGYSLDHLS
jgi:hypothetical protein